MRQLFRPVQTVLVLVVFSLVPFKAAARPDQRPAGHDRGRAASPLTRVQLDAQFATVVQPFLKTYCGPCHDGPNSEAGFDISTYKTTDATLQDSRWAVVLERIEKEEMPADWTQGSSRS